MAKSIMKFLALPALLAGAAQALTFTNNIPVDSYYKVGSEFTLEWLPETRTDSFRLEVSSFLAEPILVSPSGGPLGSPIYDYKSQTILLDDAVKFTDGSYTWVIEKIDGRTGGDWFYGFSASWEYGGSSPRSFHLEA
ncbi:hypothetical protein F5B22DRAFT_211247 [Xylaria bambusicola]|uniref:uncharacterized protein n=1 Tax=Xylaria bambusicola TaxID=326684 RepID=UPI0020085FA2|nr:uncharacterized protein F5B22DRAFT_211247 [Xylaria bambusicola]KAI0514977.1 hypothetical protein F5B22DRAFT_211247 [Xylaria bambusicola]